VGRLENIIARNRRPVGFRATAGLLWRGLFLLFILGALIFTDWALTDRSGPAPAARPPSPGEHRLDGVPVLRSPARPRPQPPQSQPPQPQPPQPR
jgi:hypothetical protein